jgi:hypothetical protein
VDAVFTDPGLGKEALKAYAEAGARIQTVNEKDG